MVSDFFYPNLGGVETHILMLSRCLIELGHHVIVVTHERGDRRGVRYMQGGVKCYYLPFRLNFDQCALPSGPPLAFLPLFRQVVIRERIDVVHGHQALSTMAMECCMHAKLLGVKTVLTDHSLIGVNKDMANIHLNKLIMTMGTMVSYKI